MVWRNIPYSYRSPYPIAGSSRVAIESRKHAASRPRPPFPSAASGSSSRRPGQSSDPCLTASSTRGLRRRFVTLLASERPIRNSIER
jgi:hypothetical protein